MRLRLSTLWLLAASVSVAADDWQMTEPSELSFEAYWEDTALPGRFDRFDVELVTADGSIDGGSLLVSVDLVAADMEDPDINEAIAGEDWFAIERFPLATFKSEIIRQAGKNRYVAEGMLDLKGTVEAIAVPLTWETSSSTAMISGEIVLDRTRFAIGAGEWADDESIGKNVRVTFRVSFERR